MKKFTFDAPHSSTLRFEKITESDLSLIRRFGIKDWNNKEFDENLLLKYGNWVVNADKSVIFKALGGGAFEIPEMYDLVYKGTRIRLECGGAGAFARKYVKNEDQSYETTVCVTRIRIPPELSPEKDSVLALAAEAFAAESLRSATRGKLTVEFNA